MEEESGGIYFVLATGQGLNPGADGDSSSNQAADYTVNDSAVYSLLYVAAVAFAKVASRNCVYV